MLGGPPFHRGDQPFQLLGRLVSALFTAKGWLRLGSHILTVLSFSFLLLALCLLGRSYASIVAVFPTIEIFP